MTRSHEDIAFGWSIYTLIRKIGQGLVETAWEFHISDYWFLSSTFPRRR
jgi:hypothetical protein